MIFSYRFYINMNSREIHYRFQHPRRPSACCDNTVAKDGEFLKETIVKMINIANLGKYALEQFSYCTSSKITFFVPIAIINNANCFDESKFVANILDCQLQFKTFSLDKFVEYTWEYSFASAQSGKVLQRRLLLCTHRVFPGLWINSRSEREWERERERRESWYRFF